MKKLIFALFGATAMALIPTGVNATTQKDYGNGECAIVVNAGETANIGSTNCRILNYGTLNINGATIQKLTTFDGVADDGIGRFYDAAILNRGGIVNMNGGTVYANYGYGIVNRDGGTVNVKGGTIHSILHQAIHSNSGNVNVYGGTLKGAIGGEQVIYTNGNVTICGGSFNGPKSNRGTAAETANCPKQVEPVKAASSDAETFTITVTASIKDDKKAETTASPKTTAKATTTTKKVATTQTATSTTPKAAEEKTVENKTETPKKTEQKEDKKADTENAEKTEGEENTEDNNMLVFAIAAIITVLGTATAAVVTSRIRH